MQKPIIKYLFLTLFLSLSACSFMHYGGENYKRASVVDFLYPDGETIVPPTTTPYLELPL